VNASPAQADAVRSRSRVQSVSRACELLRLLETEAVEDASVLGLAKASGLDRTVTYRLLRTLVDNGLASETGGRYAVGAHAATLSLAYIEQTGLRQAALPYAVELHTTLADTPWIVSLAVPAVDCAILIERLWTSKAPLSTLIDLGTRLSLPRSSIGRCFLAYGVGLTPDLARDEDLAARLADIRAAGGVEYSFGEVRPGIGALACVIQNRHGDVVGAICVSGSDIEPVLSRHSAVAQRLARTASSISRALR
jgi:IclR family acetate operon transcriptional repressor